MLELGRVVTVRMLLKGLYEKACQQKVTRTKRPTDFLQQLVLLAVCLL